MNGLYPIIRRARRSLLPPDDAVGRVTRVPVSTPGQGLTELVLPSERPGASEPPLVKLDDAFTEAEKRKGKSGGKGGS